MSKKTLIPLLVTLALAWSLPAPWAAASQAKKESKTVSAEVSDALQGLAVHAKLVNKLGADALRISVSRLARRLRAQRTASGMTEAVLSETQLAALSALEVHQAMTARGYRGNARTLEAFAVARLDLFAALATVLAAVAVLIGDHVVGR